MNTKNKILTGCLCALGCETLYGLSYIFTKHATGSASEFALLGWRFLIAVIVMSICAFFGVFQIHLKGKSLKPLMAVALFNPCIYFIGETVGISRTTASESGVFLACIPVASLFASTLILKKRPTKIQVTGILITLVGVVFTVVAAGTSSSLSVVGYGCLFLAVLSYSLYSVYVERADQYTGAEITYIMLVAGAIFFVLAALIEAIHGGSLAQLIALPVRNMGFLTAILYQGIGCSVLAFLMNNAAIARIGVNRTSSFIGVSTVVSIIAGVLFLGEKMTVLQIIGAIVIVAGVYTANASLKEG